MAVQTPAQRAANNIYHRREEAKKGKRTVNKDGNKQAAKVPRKPVNRKTKGFSLPISKTAFAFITFAVCGGAIVQLLYLFSTPSR